MNTDRPAPPRTSTFIFSEIIEAASLGNKSHPSKMRIFNNPSLFDLSIACVETSLNNNQLFYFAKSEQAAMNNRR